VAHLRAHRTAFLRVAALGFTLVALFVASRKAGIEVSAHSIERWGDDLGIAGVLAFVPAMVVLSCAFLLFIPIMAGGAGLLFGVPLGAALSIVTVAVAAGAQNAIGRRFAGGHMERLLGERGRRIDELLERRGLAAVIYVRLTPFAPYTTLNYATGTTRITPRAMALGTGVGMGPRVYAYTALGGNLHDLGSTQAVVALAIIAGCGVLGLWLMLRAFMRRRRSAA
jgi:uncharacterized membrane protein YdjX (TVP38/TMEM64 family)